MSQTGDSETSCLEIKVPLLASPERLDRFLASQPQVGLTRSRLQKLIGDHLILVDGRPVGKKYLLKGNELIKVTVPPPRPCGVTGEDIPLKIVYEDDQVVVVDKPAGLVTHPAPGNYTGTLVNALVYHFSKLAKGSAVDRPGIIHRLDKNTSGLILVARTDEAFQYLQLQMQKRDIRRTYLALVCGHMRNDEGTIRLPVGRSVKDRKKMVVTNAAGREAITTYRVKERFRAYDLLEVELLTGRTHQIRVHLSHLGHPVLGDPEYGGRQKWLRGAFGPERQLGRRLLALIDRQALHAIRLQFRHPSTGQPVQLNSDLPHDFTAALELLRNEGQ